MPTHRDALERELHARLHELANRGVACGDLSDLHAALDEAIATTMSIVDAARAALGKVVLALQLVDLRELVEEAVDAASALFSARAHSVALLAGSAPIWSRVDPARMTQVVGNLLDNAARYTPRGGRIVVCVESTGDRAIVRVRDNGVGISGDALEHIFEPFERRPGLEPPGEQRPLEVGVGLAVVRGLVRLHGGDVAARSAGVGLGAELVVTLPVVPSAGAWSGTEALDARVRVGEGDDDPARSVREDAFGRASAN